MFPEDPICGDGRRLGAVADAELGVEMTELRLDGVLTDVEVTAKFTIRHSRRKQGQEFALSFGETHFASRPAQRLIDLCVLRPLGQNHLFAPRCRPDAVDDLIPRDGFGDESLCTSAKGSSHRLGAVRKAEDHDGPIFRVGPERAHSFIEGLQFSVGVEQRDVNASPRTLPHVKLDDPDLRVAGLEEGAEPFQNDHVIVDERDPNRIGHKHILCAEPDSEITRSGD
jgi:hypothetical protein